MDALLEQDRWLGDRLDLLTFDGWIERSGQRIAALLSRLPTEAVEVATMISESGPIELIDGLMLLPKAILGELVGIKDHLGPELSAVIDELAVVAAGAENMVTIAAREKYLVR